MKSIRIGNDIRIVWPIVLSGDVSKLKDLDLTVEVRPSKKIVDVRNYADSEINKVNSFKKTETTILMNGGVVCRPDNGSGKECCDVRPLYDNPQTAPVKLPYTIENNTLIAIWSANKQFATGDYDIVLYGRKNKGGQTVCDQYRFVRLVSHTAQIDNEDNCGVEPVITMQPTTVELSGLSAYEVAVLEGFSGTREEWVESLKQPAKDAANEAEENFKTYQLETDKKVSEFVNRKVTPEMLSESTKQLIEASGGGTITNLADDEDITSVDDGTGSNVLKFKDRAYSPSTFSGKGYKILRKNIVNGKNVLTQDMINEPNTRYVVQYDFDLNEEEITIPEGCILQFEGGSVRNGDIKGVIENKYIYPEWFGAKGDGITNDTKAIQLALNVAKLTNYCCTVKFTKYYLIDTINIDGTKIEGIKDNTRYIGSNNETIDTLKSKLPSFFIRNSNTEYAIYSNNMCKISNISVFGNYKNGDAIHIHNNVDGEYIDGIFICCNGGIGLYANQISLRNSNIYNCNGVGIYINYFVDRRIEDCNVSTCNDNYYLNISSNSEIVNSKSEWSKENNLVIYWAENIKFINVRFDTPNWYNVVSISNIINIYFDNCLFIGGRRDYNYETDKYDYIPELNKDNTGYKYNCILQNSSKLFFTNCYFNAISKTFDTAKIQSFICDYNEGYNISVYFVNNIIENYSKFIRQFINNITYVNNVDNAGDKLSQGIFYNELENTENWIYNPKKTLFKLKDDYIVRDNEDDIKYLATTGLYSKNSVATTPDEFARQGRFIINRDIVVTTSWLTLYPNSILDFTLGGSLTIQNSSGEKGTLEINNSTLIIGIPKINANIIGNNKYIGNISNRNTLNLGKLDIGYNYLNTERHRLEIWDGEYWRTIEGLYSDNVLSSGTFNNKPYDDNIPVGYAYFCTDKQTAEGSTNGIMIYYKGNNIWVDALGRVVDDNYPIKENGTTEQRPIDINTGFEYFDTDLNKPIYWTGSKWVDAAGADV